MIEIERGEKAHIYDVLRERSVFIHLLFVRPVELRLLD